MNDYTGKLCPYCKTVFKPSDDIIVCSACDMPHHKDCWVENQGCTTFGCLGTIKSADHTATSVTSTQMDYDDSPSNSAGVVFCTQCGTQHASTFSFCSHCGSKLTTLPERMPQFSAHTQTNFNYSNSYAYTDQQNPTYRSFPNNQTACVDPDVQQLIGDKVDYYIPIFRMMQSEGKSASWNWSAFLVTPYWMMYRKMYGYAAAILAVDVFLFLIASPLLYLLAFGGYITFGMLGNSIYMKYLESKATQAKTMNEPYKSQFITSNRGVNTTATALAIITRVIMGILLG